MVTRNIKVLQRYWLTNYCFVADHFLAPKTPANSTKHTTVAVLHPGVFLLPKKHFLLHFLDYRFCHAYLYFSETQRILSVTCFENDDDRSSKMCPHRRLWLAVTGLSEPLSFPWIIYWPRAIRVMGFVKPWYMN